MYFLFLQSYSLVPLSVHHAFANSSHAFILQIVILHTVILSFSFQSWAIQYGLVAYGADVDLKSFPLVRAPFKGLSFDEVS